MSNDNVISRFFNQLPPVTRHLLLVNIVVWVVTAVLYQFQHFDAAKYLGLHYFEASDFNLAQLVTYMFLHDMDGVGHIFFNMFSLYMFGRILEQIMGSKRFLIYYFVCGIGAGLVQEAAMYHDLHHIIADGYQNVNMWGTIMPLQQYLNMNIAVGASGAVFGLLLAFGMLLPNVPLYLFFIPVPIKAKWMVIGYGLIELLFGLSGMMSGVAHFAHLGGLLFGFVLILIWKKNGTINTYN